jgi:hypothetical protein
MRWPKITIGINGYVGKNGERSNFHRLMLSSIEAKSQNYDNYTVVMYDDCSPRDDIEKLCREFESRIPLHYVRGEKPGVKTACIRNALMKECMKFSPEYYFCYDDDYEIMADNWLNHIAACMKTFPEIGILCAHWARLEDGLTRQRQHAPFCFDCNKYAGECGHLAALMRNGLKVWTNKFATGGCYTVRKEIVESDIGMYPEDYPYNNGNPGADTYYCNRMMEQTNYLLCTTEHDLVWHRGQEFMRGQYMHKYDNTDFNSSKQIY